MFLEVSNLGNLKHAKIDLSKKLTVFTGQNNTGKTYLSYLIQGISSNELTSALPPIRELEKLFKKIYTHTEFEIDALEVYGSWGTEIMAGLSDNLKRMLPNLLALSPENLTDTNVKLLSDYETDSKVLNSKRYNSSYTSQYFNISKIKVLNSPIFKYRSTVKIVRDVKEDLTYQQFYDQFLRELLNINQTFLIPAERIGISIFSKEIFENRFNLTSQFTKSNNSFNNALGQYANLYPEGINEALRTENKIGQIPSNSKNGLESLANELEEKVLHGKLEVSQNGGIEFQVNGKSIKIQSAGSTIKSLSSLVLHLRKFYLRGHTLIIDEPEMNLHPDNQRIVARIIAKLVNLDIKIIVSTHSDYIIRELNNLLMLSSGTPTAQNLKVKYGYEDSEILTPESINAYLFKRDNSGASIATEIPISDRGILPETIDEVIQSQTETSRDIYLSLVEEKENAHSNNGTTESN